MRVALKELVGSRDTLAGAALGQEVFARLSMIEMPAYEPEPCFIDFSGVEIATASFLRESVVQFKNYCRAVKKNAYPVISNANKETLDEADLVLRITGDAMMSAIVDECDSVIRWVLLGDLDKKQRLAFDVIMDIGIVTATILSEKYRAREDVGVTAWNNRLAALASKGLVLERSLGRQKGYAMLF